MRFLGIDFGTKKVGLALSDEEGRVAFPLVTLGAGSNLVPTVANLVKEKHVHAVVLGESKDFKGRDNPVMQKAHIFKGELEAATDVPVYFETETFTSQEAKRIQGDVAELDASAAAIILQSYLDKQHG